MAGKQNGNEEKIKSSFWRKGFSVAAAVTKIISKSASN